MRESLLNRLLGLRKVSGKRGEPIPEFHSGMPDSEHLSGICPRCCNQSSFDSAGSLPLTFDGGYLSQRDGAITPTFSERSTVLVCRHCSQGVAVLEEECIGGRRRSEIGKGGAVTWRGFHWWPLASAEVHVSVPKAIGSAYNEAVVALAAGCPRASAVMARRTLEGIADDRGEKTGTLAKRLSNLAAKGELHPTLANWAAEVRLIGNAGAHFDPIEDVSTDDAQQLVGFLAELTKFLYVLPHQLNERRSKKP